MHLLQIVDSLQDEHGPGITVYAAPEVLIRSQSPTAFRPFNLKVSFCVDNPRRVSLLSDQSGRTEPNFYQTMLGFRH